MTESKLQLRRETLRQLSSEILEHVHGGTLTALTGVGTGVWAGAVGAVGAAAKWANAHLPPWNPNAGYKPYGY